MLKNALKNCIKNQQFEYDYYYDWEMKKDTMNLFEAGRDGR